MSVQKSLADAMLELCKEKGWKTEIIHIELKYTDAIRDYVMKIEEAHKRAAESTLVFRYPFSMN